jgi:hypothetical protein
VLPDRGYQLGRIHDQEPQESKLQLQRGGNMGKLNWSKRVCTLFLICITTAIALPAQTSTTTFATLHSFDDTGGSYPTAGLVQATNGNFYGTTHDGGVSGYGTAFILSVGLGPFVETQPKLGKVGVGVKILGTNLTGATSVTFNGTSAAFTVLSGSLISATVPAGATTGTLQVVTPIGTLSSSVPFRVRNDNW